MKTRVLSIAMIIFATILFSSCEKEVIDDVVEETASLLPGQCEIKCNVSGAATSTFASNLLISTAIKSTDLMNISGAGVSSSDAEIVMIILPANVTTGTYTSSSWESGFFALAYTKGSYAWAAEQNQSFTITISEVTSTNIKGTFSGVLINEDLASQVNITNGTFSAKFTTY